MESAFRELMRVFHIFKWTCLHELNLDHFKYAQKERLYKLDLLEWLNKINTKYAN